MQMATAALPLLKQSYGLTRLLWGSDWPHTQHEQITGYGPECERFGSLLPDPAERAQVLGSTAAALFQLD